MHHLAISITDLGDSAVTLPMAAVTILILMVLRRSRPALLWGGSIVACAGTIGVLKLILIAAAPHYSVNGFSTSGHAGMSVVVYGGFVLLIGPSLAPPERWLARVGAVALIAAIAVSRVMLRKHSLAEIAVGLGVGLVALAGLRSLFKRAPRERLPAMWLCAAAFVTIVVMHGTRWHTESVIRDLARSDVVQTILPGRG